MNIVKKGDYTFDSYSKSVQKHPKAIVAVWIVALIIAVPFALQSESVLNYDMTSMGGFDSESTEGNGLMDEHFSNGISAKAILVVPYSDAYQLAEIQDKLIASGALDKRVQERYGSEVTTMAMGSYSKDGSASGICLVAFEFPEGKAVTDEVGTLRGIVSDAKADAGLSGLKTYVTGAAAISYDTMQEASRDVQIIDPLSVILIFALLALFFWTICTAIIPPAVVGAAYGIVLALIYGLGMILDIFYVTKVIVLVSMLGAGCDYSVFIVSRYREERKKGASKEDSITDAVRWAGESVFTSGLAVIIGFAVMSFCTFSLLSSMAIILALGIVMAMAAALTLIPAVLSLIGDKVFWPRSIDYYKAGTRKGSYAKAVNFSKSYYTRAADIALKHSKAIVIAVILLTVPLAYVAVTSEDSFDMISVMPDSEGKEGIQVITENADGGMIMPSYVVVDVGSEAAEISPLPMEGLGTLVWTEYGREVLAGSAASAAKIVSSDGNISTAMSPMSWAAMYQSAYKAIQGKGIPESMITAEMVNRAITDQMPDLVSMQLEERLFGTYGWDIKPDDTLWGAIYGAAYKAILVKGVPESMITVEMVNRAAVSAVPEPISSSLTQMFDSYGWGLPPEAVSANVPALGSTIASMIDYSLNIGAGLVSDDGKYIRMMVLVKDEPMSRASMDSIGGMRDVMSSVVGDGSGWAKGSWVTGTGAILYDISEVVGHEFTLIEIAVVVLIFVLLFLVLGSYLTPVRSLATIIMSVVWTLGLLQIVFSRILGIDIVWMVPIILFVICLGLGMDYDILLTTRIREGKIRGMSNDEAIKNAVIRSGPIIALCGLIMGGTFLTMLVSGSAMLQEIGFALGVAILVDSLVVVPFIVPALMHLMGDWSWKGPKFLRKDGIN
ncbi:MAG: MMPL family transporter [Candidatus Methanomethylophilaceae archaeon]|nr:MMPL family transporter [Candidatus Methanomethylophilaceae archaeon]